MTYISSQSLMTPLRTSVMQAQTALAQAQTEISTGAPADLGLTIGGSTGYYLSMRGQIDQLGGYTASNATATTRLDATAGALTTMLSAAQSMSSTLIAATGTSGTTASLKTTVDATLKSFMAQLNTTVGNQSIFGGINTAQSPIADFLSTTPSAASQAIDASFSQQFGTTASDSAAAAISGSDMKSYLDTQFASLFTSTAWQQNWSSATDGTMQTAVAPGQTASTSVSANETAFRQIAQAYAMVSAFASSNLGTDAKQAVVTSATSLLSAGIAGLTTLQGTVGIAQNTVSSATSQIASQTTLLQNGTSSLDSVDTYALSSRVTALQTQLQAAYEMTSRLQSLSLTSYLSG